MAAVKRGIFVVALVALGVMSARHGGVRAIG